MLIDADLFDRLTATLHEGMTIPTVADGRPNRIVGVSREGLLFDTPRSASAGGPRLVPGWMFNVAWRELTDGHDLTARELVMVAKQSSVVCVVLAQLPEGEVLASRPIRMRLRP